VLGLERAGAGGGGGDPEVAVGVGARRDPAERDPIMTTWRLAV
jgi:hypothetical protein